MSNIMSDRYEEYKAKVKELAQNVKPAKEITQYTLWLKAVGTEAFEGFEDCGYAKYDGKFFFTEAMVNQLMQYAFDQGTKDRDKASFNFGYNSAMKDVAEKLGMEYEP